MRTLIVLLTATGLFGLAAGCGSSGSKVSVDAVHQAADKLVAAPTAPCPLGLDVNAALKSAGISTAATPGADGSPAAEGESDRNGLAGSSGVQQHAAMVTCHYTLSGGVGLDVNLTAVGKGSAILILAPVLARDGHLTVTEIQALVSRKIDAGSTVATPDGGYAAISKLHASGGDAILEARAVAATGGTDSGLVTGEPLRKLTAALADQVRIK